MRYAGGSEHYWVKRYSRAGDARKEWLFLLHRARSGAFELAHAAAYLPPPFDALITTHAEGETLASRFQGTGRPGAVQHDCFAAGSWLAELHGQPHPGHLGTHPPTCLVRDVELRLRSIANTWDLPSTLCDQLLGEVNRRLANNGLTGMSRVRTHGDFAPFNIIVNERSSRGTIIDPSFEDSIDKLDNQCAGGEDAARFLTAIGLETSLDVWERRVATARFMDGYGTRKAELASPAFSVFLLKYRLQGLIDVWPGAMAEARGIGVAATLRGWMDGV